jgi:hypothetical protein
VRRSPTKQNPSRDILHLRKRTLGAQEIVTDLRGTDASHVSLAMTSRLLPAAARVADAVLLVCGAEVPPLRRQS